MPHIFERSTGAKPSAAPAERDKRPSLWEHRWALFPGEGISVQELLTWLLATQEVVGLCKEENAACLQKNKLIPLVFLILCSFPFTVILTQKAIFRQIGSPAALLMADANMQYFSFFKKYLPFPPRSTGFCTWFLPPQQPWGVG